MSVEEMIAELQQMRSIERLRVKRAIERLESEPAEMDDDARRRGDEVWTRFLQGVASAPGLHPSADIDESVYGGDR